MNTEPRLYNHKDAGCEVSLTCLSCPLPQCKYDDPAWFQRHRRQIRDLQRLTIMRREALTVEAAAERFSVVERTIFRITARGRERGD